MATNRLVLRSTASPYTFPLPDIVKGSVLAWDEVDNNFIFLKGLDIRSGSVSGSDLILNRINGDNLTIDLSAFTGGSGTDVFVTGGTYIGNTLEFTNNSGGTFNVTGITSTDYYTTGLTFNSGTYDLTVSLNNGSAFTQSLGILSGDMTITGGTYNPSNGVGTFTNNSGGTFDVTGFLTGYTDTDKFVTGGTYNPSTAIITFTNNSGDTFNVTGISGGTSSGVYSQTNNYTSGVTQTINHSAGTTDVLVQIINTSTNELVSGDIDNYQTNSLDVTLSQTLSNIKVVVVGGASGGGGDFTGNTSGTCINELYVTNLIGCSPVTIGNGSEAFVASGDSTFNSDAYFLGDIYSGGTNLLDIFSGSTGSGSTSPAGSNTQIQFNDSGSFGANTGFTFDTTSQTLFTESNVSGTSVNFYNGLSNFDVGFGPSEVIGTTTIYNADPIGSASGFTMFSMGDLTDVFGTDNTYLLGFSNTAGNTNSFINGSPEGTRIMYTPSDGGGGNNNIEVGYGGITNVILSGKTFEVQGVSNTLLNVNNTGTTFHSTYTFPTTDGTNGQVLQTDGSGTVTWANVSGGTGSGSTSPGGNDGDIQFNNLGTFGGDGNFNWDYGNGNLYFEGGDGQSSTLNVGQLDNSVLGGTGVTRGTSLVYNNSLSGLSANTVFLMGDTGEMLGDNAMITGYLDVVNDVTNVILTNPYITQLVANRDGYNTLISMQGSRGIDLQTSDSGGTQTARVTIDPTRGVSNFISDGNNFNVSTNLNTPLTITSAITINNEYTLPNFDGTNSQVMTTNGSGVITWETVSGGTGSTSPAGSNTQIQFNDSGSFGANTGFTYSALTNAFSTKSNYGTKSINLGSGVVDMGPFGTLTGITGNRYNNSLSGASANSFFLQGDVSPLGGSDNTTFFGYFNQSTNLMSSVNLNPDSSTLNYNTSGNTVQNSINLNATQSKLNRTNNSLNTQSFIKLTDSDTEVYFQDSNNSKDAFLDLTADAITLNLNKTGIPSGSTGFHITDTAINANLGNSGASQSFSVNNMTPSGWVKRLEVADSGSVTINESFTFPNVDGSEGQTLQTDGAGTVSWANPYIGGMFAQTGDSATVSATTTETSIVGDGVGSLSVPADSFRIGDSFHAKIGGYISSQNNAELTMRIKADGSTLTTLGPIVLPTMSNQFWELEVDFTMRVTGATGSIQTNGQFVYVQNSGNNYNGYGFNTDSSIDTTVLNELGITVEWDTTNVSNAIMSDLFYLKKCY